MNLLSERDRSSGSRPMYSLVSSEKAFILLAEGFKVTASPMVRLAIIVGLPGFIKGTILEIPGSSMKLTRVVLG